MSFLLHKVEASSDYMMFHFLYFPPVLAQLLVRGRKGLVTGLLLRGKNFTQIIPHTMKKGSLKPLAASTSTQVKKCQSECLCSPQILMLKPHLQCEGSWSLGEMISHEGGAIVNGIVALTKETPECSLAPMVLLS